MKKHLITATLIVTMGLAVGCGTEGVSGDVTGTTSVQEMDMNVETELATEEAPMAETEALEEPSATDTVDGASANGTAATGASAVSTEAAMEATSVTGVVEEMKDFMFTITDDAGTAYAFPYDAESGLDLSDIQVGDKVTVNFTGTISEADAFEGEILSVEKVEE